LFFTFLFFPNQTWTEAPKQGTLAKLSSIINQLAPDNGILIGLFLSVINFFFRKRSRQAFVGITQVVTFPDIVKFLWPK
jgi:hypothetical protein